MKRNLNPVTLKRLIFIAILTVVSLCVRAQDMVPAFTPTSTQEMDRQLKSGFVQLEQINKLSEQVLKAKDLQSLVIIVSDSLRTISVSIGNLQKLRMLSIANTSIKLLPKEIGNLKELVELHLSVNYLTKVPKEIGNLTNLKKLDLSYMYLADLPAEIGQLQLLEELNIYGNRQPNRAKTAGFIPPVNGLILPQTIGGLKNLKKLNFSENA